MLTEAEAAQRTKGINDLIDVFGKGVRNDGGDMRLTGLDVEAGLVQVELSGSCASCALSQRTLHQNFEQVAKQVFPWVQTVEGTVDTSIAMSTSRSLGRGGYVAKADGMSI